MWILILLIIKLALANDDSSDPIDGDQSRKILGSSVVTSVSVIMDNGNGSKTVYTDSIGRPVGKPTVFSELASPIDLLNPDRYEFYTFDDDGNLVRRLMSLDEIKAIIATGDSDGLEFDPMVSETYIPERKVNDVLNNVQDVLKEEMELHKNKLDTNPIFDTPDVSDSWSMILPAVFGNSGADIKPEKPIIHVTPDTFTIETYDKMHTARPMQTPSKNEEISSSETEKPSAHTTLGYVSTTMPNMVETSYATNVFENVALNSNQDSPTVSTEMETPAISQSTPHKQVLTQATDGPKIAGNSGESQTSYPHIIPTTESESNTDLSENTPFSTWTPILSTIQENKEQDANMSLSTWRPDLSSAQETDNVSSTRIIHSSSPTTPLTVDTTIKMQSSSEQETSNNHEGISLFTTPYQNASSENNETHTTLNYVETKDMPENEDELMKLSTTLPSIKYNFSTDSRTETTEKMEDQQADNKIETTTLERMTPTDVTEHIVYSSTDSTFMGSIQDILSQTLEDVGGLLTNMNSTSTMQNILNVTMSEIANSSITASVTANPAENSWNNTVHPEISTTTLLEEYNKTILDLQDITQTTAVHMVFTSTESKMETESFTTELNVNQSGELTTTSPTIIQFSKTSDRPILLNITILNPENDKTNITHQDPHISDGPSKNTKTEKDSEESSVGGNSQEVTIETTTNNMDSSVESTTAGIALQNTSTPSETTDSPLNYQTEITSIYPVIINESSKPVETEPSLYPSIETTVHPSIEISINENDVNNTDVITEKLEISTEKGVIMSNELSNNTNNNEFDGASFVLLGDTNIINENDTSNESNYQTTEKEHSDFANTTTNNFEDNANVTQTVVSIQSSNETAVKEIEGKVNVTTSNRIQVDSNKDVKGENITNVNISTQSDQIGDQENPNKQVMKEGEGNEMDWTLVPTIPPHSAASSQNVQSTPPLIYPDLVAPAPIDLKTKPLHGFGLEDSTKSLYVDIFQFTQLCNDLAFGFWKTVTSEISTARSVFLSPFGSLSLLAMIFLGARGSTSGEMNEVLKLDDMATFNPHLILRNVSESIQPEEPNSGVFTSAIVRELFSDKSKGKLLPFYKERVRAFYDGFTEDVNFSEIGDVIRRRTNLQVKKHSNGRIREFLKDTSVTAKPPLAGVSVNIFQTDCAKTSTEGRDGELHFVVLPSIRQRRLVPIPAVVYKSGFLAGYEPSLDATAVALGSKDQIISTIFLIPGQQGMPAPGDGLARLEKSLVESSFKKGAWSRLLRSLIPREGLELQIPNFRHRSLINATSAIKKMGIRELFSQDKANLLGMNGIPNELFLSDVLQVNSFSTCGEMGTGDKHHSEIYPAETMRSGRFLPSGNDEDDTLYESDETLESYNHHSILSDPIYDPRFLDLPLPARPRQARVPDTPRLKFDRPFLYFVRHNPTGLILHIGRFNPRLLP